MIRAGGILLATICLALLVTATLAWFSPQLHADVMQKIAASGVAQAQNSRYTPGLFSAEHRGELHFSRSYCPGCEVMHFEGRSFHGLGALANGRATIASLQYGLNWPDLPLQPGLPTLHLNAAHDFERGLLPSLRAQIDMAAGQHIWSMNQQDWQLRHQGLGGELQAGRLQLKLPLLDLQKADHDWLQLSQITLFAAASDALNLNGEAQQLVLPQWRWSAEQVQLQYQQHGRRDKLNISAQIQTEKSELGTRAFPASNGELAIQDLNLDASLAFAQELPRLFSPQVKGAARMLGLFSLYSLHGPAFFASKPVFHLKAKDIPLSDGPAQVDIALRITKTTRRPPMHPLEWRQALQGQVNIIAPKAQLAEAWHWAAPLVSYVTGLPGNFELMRQQGWVQDLDADRAQLAFRLDPLKGPTPIATATAQSSSVQQSEPAG